MLLALVVTLIAIFAAIKLKDLDLYGDFHLELNDEVKNPSGTQWMNMGYWKVRPNIFLRRSRSNMFEFR